MIILYYYTIFASAAGLELASDPAAAVPLGAAEPIVVHRARVMSSDRSATFVVLDNPALREFYDLQLISPHGQVMGSGAVAGSSTVHYLQRHTYTICKVLLPDPEVTLDLVGDWKLVLAPRHGDEGAPIVQDVDTPAIAGLSSYAGTRLAPIGFAAAVAVASNYRMEVQVTAPSTTPGSRVVLTARLTDRGWPAGGGKVFVDVTRPDGTAVQTIPLQPAEAGTWMGEFTPTQAPGSYRFLFRARGRNAFGEVVSREASRMVTLTWPTPDTPPWSPSHLGCSLFWMVIVVLAVVLPWLVWLILRFT